MRVQGSNFREIGNFQLSKSIYPKLFTVSKQDLHQHVLHSRIHPEEFIRSARHSEQNNLLFRCLDRIFVMYSIPEGSSVTLIRKIALGQTE